VDDHGLLSYYTGGGSSRITRVPLAWIYDGDVPAGGGARND